MTTPNQIAKEIMESVTYKSYTMFMYFPTARGIDHDAYYDGDGYTYCGNCRWADSIEEAKDEIDEIE